MKAAWRHGVMVGLTIAVVVLLAVLLPSDAPRRILLAFSVLGIAGAFGLYVASYGVIALRWRLLFGETRGGLPKTIAVASVHNLYNQLFPARLGEFSILLLAKRYLGVSADVSGSSLVLARAMDFLAMGLAGLVLLGLVPARVLR